MDNTPEPEPEDVKGHLLGGIPDGEIAAQRDVFAKFGVKAKTLFEPLRSGYSTFVPAIAMKGSIKPCLEADKALQKRLMQHYSTLDAWWEEAREDFARLEGQNILPEVRSSLMESLKGKLMPLGVLDEFQAAGVFVNWWLQIRYDLKTIVSTGWHHSLIPDEYLKGAFFQKEADRIEELESKISAAQGELSEAVEAAVEVVSYEAEEGETLTAAVMRKKLKEAIDDMQDAGSASARLEVEACRREMERIVKIEKRIKDCRDQLRQQESELELKLRVKRVGDAEAKAETRELLGQLVVRVAELNPADKDDKRTLAALEKDRVALEARLGRIDGVMAEIGGRLGDGEAKGLILRKLQDWVGEQLTRYLNGEKRGWWRGWRSFGISMRCRVGCWRWSGRRRWRG